MQDVSTGVLWMVRRWRESKEKQRKEKKQKGTGSTVDQPRITCFSQPIRPGRSEIKSRMLHTAPASILRCQLRDGKGGKKGRTLGGSESAEAGRSTTGRQATGKNGFWYDSRGDDRSNRRAKEMRHISDSWTLFFLVPLFKSLHF